MQVGKGGLLGVYGDPGHPGGISWPQQGTEHTNKPRTSTQKLELARQGGFSQAQTGQDLYDKKLQGIWDEMKINDLKMSFFKDLVLFCEKFSKNSCVGLSFLKQLLCWSTCKSGLSVRLILFNHFFLQRVRQFSRPLIWPSCKSPILKAEKNSIMVCINTDLPCSSALLGAGSVVGLLARRCHQSASVRHNGLFTIHSQHCQSHVKVGQADRTLGKNVNVIKALGKILVNVP